MKLLSTAVLALFAAAPAFAGTITIDFEAAPSFASVGSTYAASGVNFGGAVQGLANDSFTTYFTNAPSPVGVMFVAPGGTAADASMNVDGDFYGLSFYYSSADASTDAVQVWSGTDGTGNLLASFSLVANATLGCTDSAYCHWDQLSASFGSAARSVTFADSTAAAAFDNIGVIPEPSSVLLAGLALGAAFVTRRRAA
ncbi:MAG: PEP-CTERM sorting domain-containing protein [Rubrivivax sp.]|nr:PEP-CTERM sorting domain-containing protein [Rubrivivax sp.]